MINDKANYTLWNGSHLVTTYPHTREGYDAALARAFELRGGLLTIYSSRDDLVWSAKGDGYGDEITTEEDFAIMDEIYSEYADIDY